ncbi:MAG TPA: terminase family protein [Cyanophyceae cyanobacterium]
MQDTAAVLLPYQIKWIEDRSEIKLIEKSRQIGITWAEAADSVLTAATTGRGGKDTWYIGANEEGALEFMQDCTFWTHQYQMAVSEIQEVTKRELEQEGVTFADKTKKNGDDVVLSDRDILAYRIRFASGYRVTGLTSRPANLRGKKGRVILDEFAFHPEPMELMKAAIALLMWGGSVHIISTHDGEDNPFNQIIKEIKSGKKPYSHHKVTFDDAIEQGLHKRICLMTGKKWTPEGEARWRQDMIDFYGDDADEELFCNPRGRSEAYIPALLVEARMSRNYSVIRLSLKDDFNQKSLDEQRRDIFIWMEYAVDPLLKALPRHQKSYYGMDFGRSGAITAIAPILTETDVRLYCPFILELRNVPIRSQKQILYRVIDHLPNFQGGAMDARGNGTAMAEFAEQDYGATRIEKVMPTQPWYLESMPLYKTALEDNLLTIPYDEDVKTDHAVIRQQNGVPKVPESSNYKGSDGGLRHGDSAIALVLGRYAARKGGSKVIKQYQQDEEKINKIPRLSDTGVRYFTADVKQVNTRPSARGIRQYF